MPMPDRLCWLQVKMLMPRLLFSGIYLYRYICFHHSSEEVRVYSFPQSTVWTWECIPFHHQQWCMWGCIHFHNRQCEREGVSLSTVNSVDIGVFSPTSWVDVRMYLFLPHAVWICRVYPFSTTSTVNVQGVSLSIACSVDVQGVSIKECIPLHRQ